MQRLCIRVADVLDYVIADNDVEHPVTKRQPNVAHDSETVTLTHLPLVFHVDRVNVER
jgi:hypothetical protein